VKPSEGHFLSGTFAAALHVSAAFGDAGGMADKPTPPQQPGAIQLQIEIDPVTANGVFVNMALVNHTETEFTLDLLYLQPQPSKAVVRARAITTPKHLKRLLHALQDNLAKYEARFGAIDLGDTPHFPGPGMN
jgi:Protein of unknown function (DUF3467)